MDRDDMLQIKEESGDTEVDIGPTTLEEIDSHYKTNQSDMNAVKQESTIDNNIVDTILSSGMKQESNDMELTGVGQRLAQATWTPSGSGSVKQGIHITVEGTNLVIGPIQHSINQQNTIVTKTESKLVDDGNDPGLCSRVKGKAGEDKRDGVEWQQFAQATLAPAGAGSVKQGIHITVEGTNLVITPIEHNINQQNTSVVKTENKIAHDVNDPVLCSRGKEKTSKDKRDELMVSEDVTSSDKKCFICQKIYCSKNYLAIHMKNIHGKDSHKCFGCKMEFESETNLQSHLKLVHLMEGYEVTSSDIKCFICQRIYCSKPNLAIHMKNVHGKGSSKCFGCKMEFKSEAYLQTHMRLVHLKEEYEVTSSDEKCFICQNIYGSKHNLAIHMRNVHGKGSRKCFGCKMEFESEAYLQTHMKLVHLKEEYEGPNQQSSCSNTVEDTSVSTRPPVDEVIAAANASTQQNAVVIKEESADQEMELGPVVFQHMDGNYRPYKEESLPD